MAGSSGVCWPGAGGHSGCNSGGSSGALVLLLGLGAMLITRKRR
jgi:uncharacterized protein (TIGR03382 family)